MWLKVGFTNHSPGVIASYYMEAVEQLGGCPTLVRTDCGSENVILAAIQTCFAGSTSHVYGTSPANQRIECWWSFFRKNRSQWWIELFESLVNDGSFEPGNARQTECLRFCFMALIRDDLDTVRQTWNTHRIRPSHGAVCPAGVPDELYFLCRPPAVDCLLPVSSLLDPEIEMQIQPNRTCEDSVFEAYLSYLCRFRNWNLLQNTDDAMKLYLNLLTLI
jgi:hypothetical protein